MDDLTVVVPTRDTRELTLNCLASLGRLGAAEPAVVVVDDGSRDGTAAAVRDRFASALVIRHEEPLGFTAAANDGLAAATGRLLLLLNSDTEIASDGGWTMLRQAFDDDPRVGIAGARLLYRDGRRQWSGGRAPTASWMFAQASGAAAALARLPGYRRLRSEGRSGAAGVAWVTGAAMCLRRETWLEVGPFDRRYELYCQDTDLCLRAATAGWKVTLLEPFRVLHLLGATIAGARATSRRFQPAAMWTDLIRLAEAHGGEDAAQRARRVLVAGARCRLLGRRLSRPGRRAASRTAWDRDTAAYADGLAALIAMRDRAAAS